MAAAAFESRRLGCPIDGLPMAPALTVWLMPCWSMRASRSAGVMKAIKWKWASTRGTVRQASVGMIWAWTQCAAHSSSGHSQRDALAVKMDIWFSCVGAAKW